MIFYYITPKQDLAVYDPETDEIVIVERKTKVRVMLDFSGGDDSVSMGDIRRPAKKSSLAGKKRKILDPEIKNQMREEIKNGADAKTIIDKYGVSAATYYHLKNENKPDGQV